jgi:hypothetical protein
MLVAAKVKMIRGGVADFILDDSKYPALSGGFGCGKSHAVVDKAIREIQQNVGRMGEKTPAIMCEPTFRMNYDILIPSLRERLDQFQIPHKMQASRDRLIVRFQGVDNHIQFLSAENYERIRGYNSPWFIIDEVDSINPRRAGNMWTILTSRLRVEGSSARGSVASTPEGFRFMWERWSPENIPKGKEGIYTLHKASTRDNPFNPPEYLDDLLRSYDSNLVRAYVDGEFVNLTQGAVYQQYSFEEHVTKDVVYDPRKPLVLGWDFNVSPMTTVVTQIHGNILHVLLCLQQNHSYTSKHAEYVIRELGQHKGGFILIGDATASSRGTTGAGRSDLEILKQVFGRRLPDQFEFRWNRRNPFRRDRINAVNSKLKNSRGEIGVRIHPKADGLIRDFLQLSYKEYSDVPDDMGGKIGHAADAFGYIVHEFWPLKEARGVA